MLLGVHSLPQLSALFAVSGMNTLPLRPSWCPLEQPGQSGTCVSEPWQAPIQSKCLPGVPSRAGAWGSCGLVERSWAGLENSRDGVMGQSVASCVNLLRSLDTSEPGFSICKMGSTGSTYPTQHMLLCFQNDWRNCFGGRRCYVSNSNRTCAFYKIHGGLLYLFLMSTSPGRLCMNGSYC